MLSERSAFPLMLCSTHVVFLLLKQFSAEIETEAEVFLSLLIKHVSSETEASEAWLGWMRVLVMEIMRGFISFLSRPWHSDLTVLKSSLCGELEGCVTKKG
jgi:hypothetical protein